MGRLRLAEALALSEKTQAEEMSGTEYDGRPSNHQTTLVKLAIEVRADVLLGPDWRRHQARTGRGKVKPAARN